jgi:hypothetical protein
MTANEKEKKSAEMANCHEILLYYYVEYGTPEAEEKRKVELPECLLDVLGKILIDRIKDKNQIPMFTDGVFSHNEMFLEKFKASISYNTQSFMGIGLDTPRHLKNRHPEGDKVVESPTQIDHVLLRILDSFLKQNDTVCA